MNKSRKLTKKEYIKIPRGYLKGLKFKIEKCPICLMEKRELVDKLYDLIISKTRKEIYSNPESPYFMPPLITKSKFKK